MNEHRFRATMWRIEQKGGWTFVDIPEDAAPDSAGPWGRTPVHATVDGVSWQTSAWRDSRRGWLLPVPKKVRGAKSPGDEVEVVLRWAY